MKPPLPTPTTTSITTTTTAKATTKATTTTTTAGAQANGLISMNFCLQFSTGQERENTGNDETV